LMCMRPLHYHPHLPSIVPGGGLSADRTTWHPSRATFFVPGTALSPIDRALCKDERHHVGWLEPIDPQVWTIPWNVHSQAKHHGSSACTSLAPSVVKVAIANPRIVGLQDRTVTCTYRKVGRARPRILSRDAREFIRRVPPACLARWLHESPALRLSSGQLCPPSRDHPPPDRARTAHGGPTQAERIPATACRLVPSLWRTEARRHAPLGDHRDVGCYRLRGATRPGNARCKTVCHLPRHPCVHILPSAYQGPLMAGLPPAPETHNRFCVPPMGAVSSWGETHATHPALTPYPRRLPA
jgi:Putative transposase